MTFNTCAVVGNSGILKRRGMGGAIDSHRGVFRINQAPVVGYEVDVGARATVRLLNSVWAGVYSAPPDSPRLLAHLQVKKTQRLILPSI
mmetsp:Transcript_31671/g.59565  ORF Transcript_31671/g.59565 Transcript_31671/m.59565 type:complete len:89 (+) Transcript_31671:3-269(+)